MFWHITSECMCVYNQAVNTILYDSPPENQSTAESDWWRNQRLCGVVIQPKWRKWQ